MAEYSKILSVEDTQQELTIYNNNGDVGIDASSIDYNGYSFNDASLSGPIEYQINKDFIRKADEKDYSKIKSAELYKPINFAETDEKVERQSTKAMKTYSDLKEDTNPIDVLMSSEPDFMSNMYNIYLLEVPAPYKNDPSKAFRMGTTLGTYVGQTTDTGRDFLSTPQSDFFSIIGMRADGISIPQKSLESSDLQFAGQKIKKITGRVNTPNKASFTIALDQSMFILDAFHRLNGDWWAKEKQSYSVLDSNFLTGGMSESNKITGKQFLLNYGNLPYHTKLKDKEDTKNVIDVIVEYDAAYQIVSRYNDISMSNDTENSIPELKDERFLKRKNRVQRYVLHDCRFLGRSSSITFSQSGAEPIKATFPFVYRRAMKVNDNGYFY